jgi:hypothetical protein
VELSKLLTASNLDCLTQPEGWWFKSGQCLVLLDNRNNNAANNTKEQTILEQQAQERRSLKREEYKLK